MNHHPIAFFYCHCNDIYHAKQLTSLLPSAMRGQVWKYTSNGVFIHKTPPDNIRRSIALYCAKSLPINTWVNSNDVFIGRENEDE